GRAPRTLARQPGARRHDHRGEAERTRARVVGRQALTELAATHARAQPGDPRPTRADRRLLASPLSPALSSRRSPLAFADAGVNWLVFSMRFWERAGSAVCLRPRSHGPAPMSSC